MASQWAAPLSILLAGVLQACGERGVPSAAPESKLNNKQQCEQQQDDLLKKATGLLAKSDAREALTILEPCASHIDSLAFSKTFDAVRAAVAKLDLDATPPDEKIGRHGALQRWKAYAGTIPEKYEAELKRLEAELAAERKRRETAYAQVARMDFWTLCTEAGRVLRTPEGKRVQPLADAILSKTGLSPQEKVAVANREVVLGMDECALAAALGKPSAVNRSVGTYGRHDQWVYRQGRYTYVYTEDGKVRSYQQ